MNDLLILGTDTDVGKTTFALLWLTAFADRYEYWKPVETGPSDTEAVRRLVSAAVIHPPVLQLRQPVAPPLAAQAEGKSVPPAVTLAAACPRPQRPDRALLIETFGSPLSPLTDAELQVGLVAALGAPMVLVSSSALGVMGRTLQCLQALDHYGLRPFAVVLLGSEDEYAAGQVRRHWPAADVFALRPPASRNEGSIRQAVADQGPVLQDLLRQALAAGSQPAAEAAAAGAGGWPWTPEALAQVRERDRRAVWHPYTSLREPDPPLVAVAARAEYLWLADGRRLIDGISSWWTILHGHRHPLLMATLAEAAQAFDHVHFAGLTHPRALELAELLLATAPWSGGRVFYSDNGSTAVEVALKMAYQLWCHRGEPGRTLFVGFEGGYHGDTFGAMAAGRDPVFFGRFEPLLFRAETVPVSAERLDDLLRARAGQVAAVIIEPLVQGAGGMRMHTPAELRAVAEAARRHDVLLIADEVMTGGGRLGPVWAHQEAGIAPDLICAAKTLTGGVLPLAATLASPTAVAAFDTADRGRTFFHGHSFTAHPLACAVAVASWKLMAATGGAAAGRLEAFWREALAPLAGHPRVHELRVRGSIAAVELAAEGGYLAEVGPLLRRHCLERGVLLRPLGNVLYAMPPLCTSAASLGQVAAAITSAVAALGG
jgi:adenosylmethionine-8-amino-7-oxononanoate aminotransferase